MGYCLKNYCRGFTFAILTLFLADLRVLDSGDGGLILNLVNYLKNGKDISSF